MFKYLKTHVNTKLNMKRSEKISASKYYLFYFILSVS